MVALVRAVPGYLKEHSTKDKFSFVEYSCLSPYGFVAIKPGVVWANFQTIYEKGSLRRTVWVRQQERRWFK